MTDLTPVATGSDILVNTFTVGAERYSSVAALEDGGFIVTWQRTNTDSTTVIEGIYGQRYDAMGVPVGEQLFLASGIFSIQAYPVVAPLSDGGFVVLQQTYTDGSFWGISGQRFDASGAAVGVGFRANTHTADSQVAPSVAALEDGGFVVTWSSNGQDGSGYGIYGQRFDAAGAATGGEFQVNATTVDHQAFSAVAGLEGGGFVVTWQSFGQDGDHYGVYGQRYDAAGVAFGAEFLINTMTGGEQAFSSVTALAEGGFVVTWSSFAQDGSSYGIYGQRYNAAGVAVGTEFQVNTETADAQNFSSVTALADGGFVVTWSSNGQDGSGWGIYGQRFAADGSALGTEFRLNDITTGDQVNESFNGQQWLATLADGRLVATWTGLGPEEVFVRLVDVPTVATPSGVTTPVDVNAAANAIDENTTGAVGITAHATDLDATDTVTYALVTDASGGGSVAGGDGLSGSGGAGGLGGDGGTGGTGDSGGLVGAGGSGGTGTTPYTGPFAIDGQTGVISLTSPLDYETDGATQTLFVQATSSDGSSAVETFTVAIGDVNETGVTTPVDVNAAANAIDENGTGAVGITAQATDPDVIDTVTYALVTDASGATPYAGPFAIDSQTGVISLTSPLDYETDGATQTLFVQATSSDGSSAVEAVTVAINNVNENPTAIAISSGMIAENSAPGTIVGTFSATDPDTGETFSYQLLDDAGGRFALDGNLLEVAGDLDFETATSHQVTVRVADSGGLSHDETFTIGVTDAVENPPSIINRDNVSDDATLNLNAAVSAASAEVGGTTYLFVTGFVDNGLSVFAVGADGVLTNVDNVVDDATLQLAGAVSVTTAVVGGTAYLFVAGMDDSGVSAFAAGADGSLVHVDDVDDNATLNLGAAADVATAVVGGTTYLFVAGVGDSGVSVFAVGNDGALTNVANVTDGATLNLQGAVSVATAEVGGTTYLFVAGLEDNGVSVFAVGDDGALTNVDNVADDATLQLAAAISVTTAVVGGTTYLFVAGVGDNGVSVFAVGNDGALTNVANVTDDATLNLDGANGVATAVIGAATYLFVAGYYEGLGVFAVGNDGALTHVASVADDATLNLLGTSSVTTAVANGTAYLFATGDQDNGVSVFELASDDRLDGTTAADTLDGAGGNDVILGLGGDDTVIGGAGDDVVLGGNGDDTLTGGAGNDRLNGGSGNDTFAFAAGFGTDTVAGFHPGAGSDDLIQFDQTLFADFDAVIANAAQVGSNTVITYDAANKITLTNVDLGSLHHDDFFFV